jgi:hypothetical protein
VQQNTNLTPQQQAKNSTQHNTLKIQEELFPEYQRNKIGKL